MPWIRFEDNFDENPKVLGLDDGSFRLWVRSVAYSNRHLTDGFISRAAARGLRPEDWARCSGRLIRAGLWEQADGGYVIHDYHHYQPTRAKIHELREVKKKAGKAGANSRWGGRNEAAG